MYEDLKQLIDDNVNTNGQRGISGTSLNGVLTAIVDMLGRGMTYGGKVYPYSDEPPREEGVFYLAEDEGTYFGEFTVGGHDFYIMYFSNGQWRYDMFNFSVSSLTVVSHPSRITAEDYAELTRRRAMFLIANDGHYMNRMFSYSHSEGTDLMFVAPPYFYDKSVYVAYISLSSVEQNGFHNYKLDEFTI